MKLSVGYPVEEAEAFCRAVDRHREAIAEVYFAWPGMPSGRMSVLPGSDTEADAAQERLLADLQQFHHAGLSLNLLFNGNCHGAEAISCSLADRIHGTIDKIACAVALPQTITTASPFIAHVIKQAYPEVEIRASVNMRFGTVEAMEYVADLFDGFCVQREWNRNLPYLETLSAWARSHGKKLTLLLNSGCLNHCANQTFHDNLVAHEQELHTQKVLPGFSPVRCWSYLARPENRAAFLTSTNWIRPEDLAYYSHLGCMGKLASRMHGRPGLVIGAYANRRHRGNMLDLLEPGMSRLLLPEILDNTRFPSDWVAQYQHAVDTGSLAEACEEWSRQIILPLQSLNDT